PGRGGKSHRSRRHARGRTPGGRGGSAKHGPDDPEARGAVAVVQGIEGVAARDPPRVRAHHAEGDPAGVGRPRPERGGPRRGEEAPRRCLRRQGNARRRGERQEATKPAPTEANRVYHTLHLFYEWLHKERQEWIGVTAHPLAGLDKPSPERVRTRTYSNQEIRALLP